MKIINKLLNKINGINLQESNRWNARGLDILTNMIYDEMAVQYSGSRPPFQLKYDYMGQDSAWIIDARRYFTIEISSSNPGKYFFVAWRDKKPIIEKLFDDLRDCIRYIKDDLKSLY